MKHPHVKLRCPVCKSQPLQSLLVRSVEVDSCLSCGGLFLGGSSLIEGNHGINKGLVSTQCPSCSTDLNCFQLAEDLILFYECCLACGGVWLDREQFDLMSNLKKMREQQELINRPPTLRDRIFQFVTSLPAEFNIKPHRKPYVTMVLIAINLVLSLYIWISKDVELVQWGGLIPAEFSILNWRLLSSLFLHTNFFHLLGNMYLLYKLGDNIEDLFGRIHFLIFFLLVGTFAGFCHIAGNLNSTSLVIGASGAVAGVMGAYLVCFRKAKLTFMILVFQWKVSAYAWLLVWLILNVGLWVTGGQNVAWLAHLGGFALGFVWAKLIYKRLIQQQPVLRLINHFLN